MKRRLKLTIDVTYNNIKPEHHKGLESNLNFLASHAMSEGLLTMGCDEAEVEEHVVRITELTPLDGKVKARRGDLVLLEDGNVQGTVRINVADFTEYEPMLEKYMDMLSEKLTGSGLLSDIRDQVVDVEDGAVLVVEVTGDPSMIEDGPVAELVKEAS